MEIKELRKQITAVDVLKKYQKQLDPDGIEVGVSRQALDEVITEIEQLRADKAELEKYLNIRVVDAINVNQWIGKLEKELNLEPCIDSEGSQFYHLPRILEAVETLAKHKEDE